jgi:hypothetical protein
VVDNNIRAKVRNLEKKRRARLSELYCKLSSIVSSKEEEELSSQARLTKEKILELALERIKGKVIFCLFQCSTSNPC